MKPVTYTLSAKKLREPHKLEARAQLRQSLAVANNNKSPAFYSAVERKLARLKGTKSSSRSGKFGFAKSYSKIETKATQAAQYKNRDLRGVYLGNVGVLLQQALAYRRLTRRARKLKILGRRSSRNYVVKTRPF